MKVVLTHTSTVFISFKISLKMSRSSTHGNQRYKNLSHKKQPKINLIDDGFLNSQSCG